jgi:transcriptional regulator with XRE-family HTH domain
MPQTALAVGHHLRRWRERRRLSQLDLACDAEISARHLSFLETGRASPSREMVLRLCEQLEVPRRERNVLLLAAGYAPMFSEKALDDPALRAPQRAISAMLESQKPYPAFAIDRGWNIIASNGALQELYVGVAPWLLEPPVNVLRLGLHPEGLAPRTLNFADWSGHLLSRLKRQAELTGDEALAALAREASAYPNLAGRSVDHSPSDVALPFRIAVEGAVLSFLSSVMVFGTPLDVTLSELAIELFFPADEETAQRVRALEARRLSTGA